MEKKIHGEKGSSKFVVLHNNVKQKISNSRHFETEKHFIISSSQISKVWWPLSMVYYNFYAKVLPGTEFLQGIPTPHPHTHTPHPPWPPTGGFFAWALKFKVLNDCPIISSNQFVVTLGWQSRKFPSFFFSNSVYIMDFFESLFTGGASKIHYLAYQIAINTKL